MNDCDGKYVTFGISGGQTHPASNTLRFLFGLSEGQTAYKLFLLLFYNTNVFLVSTEDRVDT